MELEAGAAAAAAREAATGASSAATTARRGFQSLLTILHREGLDVDANEHLAEHTRSRT